MRVLHGRGIFWTICMLLLTGKAAAQTYPNTYNSPSYGAPATIARVEPQPPAPPADPVYVGTGVYGGPTQSPAPVQVQKDDYKAAMSGDWNSCAPPVWFGSAGAVFFKRQEYDRRLSCYTDESIPSMHYRDAGMPTTVGPNITFGRYLGCGNTGVQFVYWGLYPSTQYANQYANQTDGNVHSTPDWSGIGYPDWSGIGYNPNVDPPVSNVYDNAQRHELQRNFSVHNFEINFLSFSNTYGNGCGSSTACGFGNGYSPSFRYSFLGGFRYINFNENFLFSADADDTVWDSSDNERHYLVDVKNRLAGFQVGGRTDYFFTESLSVFATGKTGIFGNSMSMHQSIYGPTGYAFVTNPVSSNLGKPYDIYGSKTNVSFVADFSVGGSYYITKCLSVYAGYQVVAVTGVAEANDQIPTAFYQLQDNSHIRDDGTLILHGAFAGVGYNW